MVDGLTIRIRPHRRLCGLANVPNGTMEIASALKVHSEFRRHLIESALIRPFQTFTNPSVQTDAAARRHLLIQHVLVDRVNETITRNECSVWPLSFPNRLEELFPARQIRTKHFNSFVFSPEPSRDRRGRKLHSCCTCSHEHLLFFGAHLLDVMLDQLPQAFWHPARCSARHLRLTFPLPTAKLLLVFQIVGDIHHEQRVTLGMMINNLFHTSGERSVRKSLHEIVFDVLFGKGTERKLTITPGALDFLPRLF